VIAFILPKSFSNPYNQRFFPLCFHLVLDHHLPNNCFLVRGMEHHVPCTFQIWEKSSLLRAEYIPTQSLFFSFVSSSSHHHFAIGQCPPYAIETKNTTYLRENIHYFIKFNDGFEIDIDMFLQELSLVSFQQCKNNIMHFLSKDELNIITNDIISRMLKK